MGNCRPMEPNEFWDALKSDDPPLLREIWPGTRPVSFREALSLLDPKAANRLEASAQFVSGLSAVPILAVAGAINGGKSSLVASFLSPSGRERVLRGLGSQEGTQRFVLWIPEKWTGDPAFLGTFEKLLADVFGHAPEQLADDPDTAHGQYRQRDRFGIPLVAGNPALDDHGIALLDCPDIQRPQEHEPPGSNLRLEAVRKASEICAGIILVAPRAQLEIREIVTLVKGLIPRAVRIFAINLIRPPERPEAVREELERALSTKVTDCYGAYDFAIETSRKFSPEWDPNRDLPESERLPCFFAIDRDPAENVPSAVGRDRSILALPKRITPESMRQLRQQEMKREFASDIERQLGKVEESIRERAAIVEAAAERLFERCDALLRSDNGKLRVKMDPEIVASFKEAMDRTAPFYLKPFMLAHRWLYNKAMAVVAAGRERVGRIFGVFEKQRDFAPMRDRLKRKLIQPGDMERELAHWSVAIRDKRPGSTWSETAQSILDRYQEEEKTNMSRDEWTAVAHRIWSHTGKVRATMQIFATFFLGLAAIVLIPFDAGHSVLGMTVLEMFGVLGLSGIVTAGTLASLGEEITRKLAHQQLANFCAIAGDALALPRRIVESVLHRRALPAPSVAERINPAGYGLRERRWQVFELDPKGLAAIRRGLARFRKENS